MPGHRTVDGELDCPALQAHDPVLTIAGGFELDLEPELVDVEVFRDAEIVPGQDRHSTLEHGFLLIICRRRTSTSLLQACRRRAART
jgi:hypothetical protein